MSDTPRPQITRDDASSLDKSLRPQTWEEYVGQTKTKENLRILLTAVNVVMQLNTSFSMALQVLARPRWPILSPKH